MLIGQILRKRYKIVRLLGSGSFGVTYLAEDLDLPDHPLCVVKNLKQDQNSEYLKLARRLFDKEAQVLYRLGNECSQIPRVFAHFEENGEFYLVQEFVDGHDLSQEIFPGNKWSEAEVTQLLQKILEVLAFIHNKDIIHRDIKAQNLMRRHTDGKIVLIDFGAVKEISGLKANPQLQTNASIIIGTSGYMPSEQLNGYPRLSSDVYAVGMLGIYALTGIKPQELPKDLNSFSVIWRDWASVSPRLADVLDKMVRYNFNERYQTADEALQALTQLPPPPPSPPPSLATLILRQLRVNPILIGAVVGLGVLLGVGLLFRTPRQSVTDSGQPALEPGQPTLDSRQPTPDDVQLVCPETPLPELPSTPDWEKNNAKYYGFPNVSQPTGKGIMIYPDVKGEYYRYDGELKKGVFSGCGTYTFANGDRYIGEFENNSFQGTGKFIYKNGCQYIGTFNKSLFDGQGTFISIDGSSNSGIWQKGKLKGSNKNFISCE